MFETKTPDDRKEALSGQLLAFYDDFSEFNDYAAFLCDAFASVASIEGGLDESSLPGMKRSAQWLKERMEQLKNELQQIQENAAGKR